MKLSYDDLRALISRWRAYRPENCNSHECADELAAALAQQAQPEPERCPDCRPGKKCGNCIWDDYENGRTQPKPEDAQLYPFETWAQGQGLDPNGDLAYHYAKAGWDAALRAVSQPTTDERIAEVEAWMASAAPFDHDDPRWDWWRDRPRDLAARGFAVSQPTRVQRGA